MIRAFVLLLYAYTAAAIGYDAGGGDRATCGRPYRSGRLYQPPCDLTRLGYCAQAGQLYPWRAVKRFVRDNQGLLRRMYGDQRHGHVLRMELDDDELEDEWDTRKREKPPQHTRFGRTEQDITDNDLSEEEEEEVARYLRDADLTNDDVLNTKFVISEQEAAVAIKLAELKAAAHFRPGTHRPSYTKNKVSLPTTKRRYSSSSTESGDVSKEEATTTVKNNELPPNFSETSKEPTTEALPSTVASSTMVLDDYLDQSSTDNAQTTEKSYVATTTLQQEDKIDKTKTVVEETDNSKGNSDVAEQEVDQTADFSENSDIIYSDQDGNLKQAPAGANTPTVLFQDMEQDPSKKKIDYDKMKGVNACPVKEEVVAPFWANNTRGEVLALLNMYPFEQYVHWEKCTFEHRQMYCREGCRCEQQYRLHRLLAYDPNNECRGIFSDWFRFPSCCVCKCYGLPPEFRVTSRSPRYQPPQDEDEYYNV